MAKGRQAEPGTYEARDFLVDNETNFNLWLKKCPVSLDAQKRIEKAIRFGLGVTDAETYRKKKEEKIAKLKQELAEMEK